LNLRDAVQAASSLGDIKNLEISVLRVLRTEVLDILGVMGRRFYEAVKTWGETQLNHLFNPIE
jgi:hypothetical protein